MVVDVRGEAHKLTPPDILVVSQILSEIKVVHEFKNESKWVLCGGIHSDKWCDIPVLKTTTRQRLVTEPLQMDPWSKGHDAGRYHSPRMSPSSLKTSNICKP